MGQKELKCHTGLFPFIGQKVYNQYVGNIENSLCLSVDFDLTGLVVQHHQAITKRDIIWPRYAAYTCQCL